MAVDLNGLQAGQVDRSVGTEGRISQDINFTDSLRLVNGLAQDAAQLPGDRARSAAAARIASEDAASNEGARLGLEAQQLLAIGEGDKALQLVTGYDPEVSPKAGAAFANYMRAKADSDAAVAAGAPDRLLAIQDQARRLALLAKYPELDAKIADATVGYASTDNALRNDQVIEARKRVNEGLSARNKFLEASGEVLAGKSEQQIQDLYEEKQADVRALKSFAERADKSKNVKTITDNLTEQQIRERAAEIGGPTLRTLATSVSYAYKNTPGTIDDKRLAAKAASDEAKEYLRNALTSRTGNPATIEDVSRNFGYVFENIDKLVDGVGTGDGEAKRFENSISIIQNSAVEGVYRQVGGAATARALNLILGTGGNIALQGSPTLNRIYGLAVIGAAKNEGVDFSSDKQLLDYTGKAGASAGIAGLNSVAKDFKDAGPQVLADPDLKTNAAKQTGIGVVAYSALADQRLFSDPTRAALKDILQVTSKPQFAAIGKGVPPPPVVKQNVERFVKEVRQLVETRTSQIGDDKFDVGIDQTGRVTVRPKEAIGRDDAVALQAMENDLNNGLRTLASFSGTDDYKKFVEEYPW